MLTNSYPFKKNCFKYTISVIRAKLSFSELQIQKVIYSHGNKVTILCLGSVNVPMPVISTKLYFVEISGVHQKI